MNVAFCTEDVTLVFTFGFFTKFLFGTDRSTFPQLFFKFLLFLYFNRHLFLDLLFIFRINLIKRFFFRISIICIFLIKIPLGYFVVIFMRLFIFCSDLIFFHIIRFLFKILWFSMSDFRVFSVWNQEWFCFLLFITTFNFISSFLFWWIIICLLILIQYLS
uniref:Uncharacterized protein n=1 Tax=Cacopsylla melanoneura TaxID=428564 RepID=A0A8D8XUP9_9HEMI